MPRCTTSLYVRTETAKRSQVDLVTGVDVAVPIDVFRTDRFNIAQFENVKTRPHMVPNPIVGPDNKTTHYEIPVLQIPPKRVDKEVFSRKLFLDLLLVVLPRVPF